MYHSRNACTRVFPEFTQRGLSCGLTAAASLRVFQEALKCGATAPEWVEFYAKNGVPELYERLMRNVRFPLGLKADDEVLKAARSVGVTFEIGLIEVGGEWVLGDARNLFLVNVPCENHWFALARIRGEWYYFDTLCVEDVRIPMVEDICARLEIVLK